jgi:hypothetical protein
MYLKCLDEYRAKVKGRRVIFEETKSFGYVYEVDEKVGKKLLETGKFAPCTKEEAKKLEVHTIVPAEPAPIAAAPEPEISPEMEAEPELTAEPDIKPEPELKAEAAPESESEPELAAEPEGEPETKPSRARRLK